MRPLWPAVIALAAASLSFVPAREASSPDQKIDPFQTALVLKAAREYCRRLESAALDFVCREEVTERIDLSRDVKASPGGQIVPSWSPGTYPGTYPKSQFSPPSRDFTHPGTENRYLFDYQFLRQAGAIKEKRALLEKNGKKAREKEAPPETATFQYADILMAPVRMLDERFGDYYDYRLLREDTLDGVKAWVLAVVPRFTAVDVYLGGTIWLRSGDCAVLRIDWDPATFGRYENILRRAQAYKCKPSVTSSTEFGVEKNGIRFPSVDSTEEGYLDADGKKFVRAVTRVVYKDYKFFTVETQTDFTK